MERQTKIVVTVGPTCSDEATLKRAMEAGANIMRLNFSHGDHETHGKMVDRINKVSSENGYDVSILLDTKGPEIRTGDVKNPIEVKKGDTIIFTVDHDPSEGKIGVNYDEFINDVNVGDKIIVDSGLISMLVTDKTEKDVICKAQNAGIITSKRHINLLGKKVSLKSITYKDWNDLKFGIDEKKVDFVALSFVRSAEDIKLVRKFATKYKSKVSIIAKIESYEAVTNLEEIVQEADGIMVARGDLGCEVSFTKVPGLQRKIVKLSSQYKKPVIVATHTLDSMIDNPMPTRAEVMDVSTAVMQGADAIMLSGETANGKYPIRAIEAMRDIIIETEKDVLKAQNRNPYNHLQSREELAKLAKMIPNDIEGVDAIMVISHTGNTVRLVSNQRPIVPIIAFVESHELKRQCNLLWGVDAYVMDLKDGQENSIEKAKKIFLTENPKWKGKRFVLVCSIFDNKRFVPTIQIREF